MNRNRQGIQVKGIAKYKCRKCQYIWEEPPGFIDCPKCKHIYCDWINHKEWIKRNDKSC